jgi:hypothetical protein
MWRGNLPQNREVTLKLYNNGIIFSSRLIMGQIRNVVLIIVITAIMAILMSIFVYFFDQWTTNTLRFIAANFISGLVIDLGLKYRLLF